MLASDSLCEFAVQRDNATEMEIELAQRLEIAMAMLEEINGTDSRSESQESRKAAAN